MAENQLKQYEASLTTKLGNNSIYTLVVKADEYDMYDRYITIDYIDGAPTITERTQISQYPLINGNVISDHKYDMPSVVSLRGAFSLNGKFINTFTNNEMLGDRLNNIIDYFQNVKKKGRLIDMVFVVDGAERFKKIDNLVISEFSWTPRINSMDIALTLQQVYLAEITDFDLLEDKDFPNLPTLANFRTCSFIGEVIDTDTLYGMVIEMLCNEDLVDAGFVDVMATTGKAILVSLGVSIGLSLFIISWLVSVAVKAAIVTGSAITAAISGVLATTVNPVGVVLVAGVAIVSGLVYGITQLVRHWQRKNWIKTFKRYSTEAENSAEIARFNNFLNATKDAVNKINEQITFYSFASNDDKQEYTLSIDNNYYIFKLERNSANRMWNMTITNLNDDLLSGNSQFNNLVGLSNILDATINDSLYEFENGTRIYLFNKALCLLQLDDDTLKDQLENAYYAKLLSLNDGETLDRSLVPVDKILTSDEKDELLRQFKTSGVYQDLTKYILCATKVDISKLREAMLKQIEDVMKNWANEYEQQFISVEKSLICKA